MADLFSPPLSAKAIAGIGGLIGGMVFMAFMRPKNVWDASVRSGVSVATAIIFHPIICEYLGWNGNFDHVLASSALIGFCSWSLLSVAAKLLMNIEHEKVEIKLPGLIINKQ